ncbi:hypothetical protein pb186bvf_012717 [Paramecium bursaria]
MQILEEDDLLVDLEEQFRINYTLEGNEKGFRDLLNELKHHKKELQTKLHSYSEIKIVNKSTASGASTTSRSVINEQEQIDIEINNQQQLMNVIDKTKQKIREKQLQVQDLRDNIDIINNQLNLANNEQEYSSSMKIESSKSLSKVSELLSLLNSMNKGKLMQLKKKQQILNEEIVKLKQEYLEIKNKQKSLEGKIQEQKLLIDQLQKSHDKMYLKIKSQQTIVYYINCLQLLDSMLNKNDQHKLLDQKFDQRLQQANQQKEQEENLFFVTQIDVELDESFIMGLIKKNQDNLQLSLEQIQIEQELQTFADSVIQVYRTLKEQSESLQFQFTHLNMKRYQQKDALQDLRYYKYAESSNGLLKMQLNDNYKQKEITINILSTSVEPYLRQLKESEEVNKLQKLVQRLYYFLRNHIIRLDQLILDISSLSNSVPKFLIQLMGNLKNQFLIKEVLKTPKNKQIQSTTTIVVDTKEMPSAKHSKIINPKSMHQSLLLPRASRLSINQLGRFRFQNLIQQFVKLMMQDEIEKLFINQEMIDEFHQDILRQVSGRDMDEDELHNILQNQQASFKHRVKLNTDEQLKNVLLNLGQLYLTIQKENNEYKLKGFTLKEQQYKPGQSLSINKSLEHIFQAHQNAAVSQEQYLKSNTSQIDVTQGPKMVPLSETSHDVFHFLRKIIKPTLQERQQQKMDIDESNDSLDKQRDRIKEKSYYMKNTHKILEVKRNSEDIFQRLCPKFENPAKQYKDRLSILKLMRINAKSSVSLEREYKGQVKHSQIPIKQNNTFRQLFSSSTKNQLSQLNSPIIQETAPPQKKVSYGNINSTLDNNWLKKHRAKKVHQALQEKNLQNY